MSRDVLLIGAAGGVGLATAVELTKSGRRVIPTVLDDKEEAVLREALPKIGMVHRIDLADPEGTKTRLDALLSGIDLSAAVVCAAISPYGPLEITPLSVARRTFEVNALSNIAVYQAVMPLLRRSRGRLVLTSSYTGKVPVPFVGHYSGSKHALEGYGDVMRQEAAQFGVHVVLVEPGTMNTGMTAGIRASIGAARAKLNDEERKLYGHYFKRFEEMVTQDAEGGFPPRLVAETIIAALDAATPETRYAVGEDSKMLIAKRRSETDREIDAMFQGIFFGDVSSPSSAG